MSSTVLGRNAVTVNKKYTEYFLPTVLTAMATNIAMIVDSIIAGNLLGQNSLAAINLMSPISQLYFSITILFGLGASSIISFAKGRRDEKQANRVFTSTFIVLIALSVIFIAIQLPLADSISSLLTKDAELNRHTDLPFAHVFNSLCKSRRKTCVCIKHCNCGKCRKSRT